MRDLLLLMEYCEILKKRVFSNFYATIANVLCNVMYANFATVCCKSTDLFRCGMVFEKNRYLLFKYQITEIFQNNCSTIARNRRQELGGR